MRAIAQVLRFLLELCGIAAAAAWGWSRGPGAVGFLAVVLLPAALIAVWGLLVAPRAQSPLSPTAREWVGALLLWITAFALYDVGARQLAVVYAALILIDTVALSTTHR